MNKSFRRQNVYSLHQSKTTRVLPGESIPARLVPAFRRTRRCITLFRTARHFHLSSPHPPTHPIFERSLLVLSSHVCPRLPSGHNSFWFPQSKPSTPLSSPPCVPHREPEIYFKITYETIWMSLYVRTDLNLIRPEVVSNISADAGTILKRRNVSALYKDSVRTAK